MKKKTLTVKAEEKPRPEPFHISMYGALQTCFYDVPKERAYTLSDRILNHLENENPDEIVIGMRRYIRKPTGQHAEMLRMVEELNSRIAEICQSADVWRKRKRRKKSR